MGNRLAIEVDLYEKLVGHLRQKGPEQAAFAYARVAVPDGDLNLTVRTIETLPGTDFDHQSGFHMALTDATLARVIKRAWDEDAALVEFHSHTSPKYPAAFSPSDLEGLAELVPHLWWRLRGRPYMALVVSPGDFDALVWRTSPNTPERLEEVAVGETRLAPTGITIAEFNRANGS
jgi:hypothetical protein